MHICSVGLQPARNHLLQAFNDVTEKACYDTVSDIVMTLANIQ